MHKKVKFFRDELYVWEFMNVSKIIRYGESAE